MDSEQAVNVKRMKNEMNVKRMQKECKKNAIKKS